MDFAIERQCLYKCLQKVINVISGKPRLPILSHILLEVNKNYLYITASDLEIEIVAKAPLCKTCQDFSGTISGRKFFDVCRNFSERSIILVQLKNNKLYVSSKFSKFSLSTFATADFPKIRKWNNLMQLNMDQFVLKEMIELIQFSMGNQDARYYLNGMLFEVKEHIVRFVTTDGYRLSVCNTSVDFLLSEISIIVPRKGVFEILRLLKSERELVNIKINSNYIRVQTNNCILTSKLVDGTFPNYADLFFDKSSKNVLELESNVLKEALKRASVVAHERMRVVQFHLTANRLKITASNFNNEESEEDFDVLYSGSVINICFNVDYLLDIINVIHTRSLQFFIENEISGVQIEAIPKSYDATYIIMPIRA